jgi:EAL domain-containing protein (putative c-di-GMP-specific phosphodiesterase class I)
MNDVLTERQTKWFLSEVCHDGSQSRVMNINGSPFVIGRLPEASLQIASSSISKQHAEITLHGGDLSVRDLGSTNGTFVNGKRVTHVTLLNQDLVQFANTLFRVGCREDETHHGTICEAVLPWAQTLIQFDRLMSDVAIVPHFQPIVCMASEKVLGFELLARSNITGLENPALMFEAAAKLDQECSLSMMVRREGVKLPLALPFKPLLFVNTHPKEVVNEVLIQSLHELRSQAPTLPIVVEIHEAAVSDVDSMRGLRLILDALDMQLAYDDFGAGQARIEELTEVPPDVLKFDMKLIRNIDQGNSRRHDMVESLVRIVRDLGIVALAEGVETEGEHVACRQIGFQQGQGFYYGRPAPTCVLKQR